jgi:hypothetical protein
MRRGLWLAAGAVLGVASYRRATRMVDDLLRGGSRAVPPDHYRPDSAGHSAPGRPASTTARIAATVGFARDVRDGMAEYLELHHRELARNLESRSNRTSSG